MDIKMIINATVVYVCISQIRCYVPFEVPFGTYDLMYIYLISVSLNVIISRSRNSNIITEITWITPTRQSENVREHLPHQRVMWCEYDEKELAQ